MCISKLIFCKGFSPAVAAAAGGCRKWSVKFSNDSCAMIPLCSLIDFKKFSALFEVKCSHSHLLRHRNANIRLAGRWTITKSGVQKIWTRKVYLFPYAYTQSPIPCTAIFLWCYAEFRRERFVPTTSKHTQHTQFFSLFFQNLWHLQVCSGQCE